MAIPFGPKQRPSTAYDVIREGIRQGLGDAGPHLESFQGIAYVHAEVDDPSKPYRLRVKTESGANYIISVNPTETVETSKFDKSKFSHSSVSLEQVHGIGNMVLEHKVISDRIVDGISINGSDMIAGNIKQLVSAMMFRELRFSSRVDK